MNTLWRFFSLLLENDGGKIFRNTFDWMEIYSLTNYFFFLMEDIALL